MKHDSLLSSFQWCCWVNRATLIPWCSEISLWCALVWSIFIYCTRHLIGPFSLETYVLQFSCIISWIISFFPYLYFGHPGLILRPSLLHVYFLIVVSRRILLIYISKHLYFVLFQTSQTLSSLNVFYSQLLIDALYYHLSEIYII